MRDPLLAFRARALVAPLRAVKTPNVLFLPTLDGGAVPTDLLVEVAVELRNALGVDAGAAVEAVDVLANDMLQDPLVLERHQGHVSRRGLRRGHVDALGRRTALSLARPNTIWPTEIYRREREPGEGLRERV
jgi:hypothetical protein